MHVGQFNSLLILLLTYCISILRIAVQCPAGMIYQQCGSLCTATCTSDITDDCYTGCAEGCFCPNGLVLHNGNCIDQIACPGQ